MSDSIAQVAEAIREAEPPQILGARVTTILFDELALSEAAPPRRYANLMLDIESMSLHPGRALIVSLGAVPFDLTPAEPVMGPPLLLVFDLAEQLVEGRVVDQGTQRFWNRQPRAACAHFVDPLFEGEGQIIAVRCSLHDLHRRLSNFAADHLAPGFEVYSQGVAFDIANLAGAMADDGHDTPWHYANVVDCRTLRRKLPRRRGAEAVTLPAAAHDPVHDCMKQIRALWEVATDDMLGIAPPAQDEPARAA
jgi:hypothetical protein